MPLAGLDALVDHLVESATAVPGVNGPDKLADRFAGRLARLTGTRATQTRASRMFRLDQVSPPARVAGRLRDAVASDRDLLVEWSAAFGAEATPDHPQDAARPIDLRLGQPGLLWVWEVAGRPVSTAYLGEPAVGVVRVSGVYTPPALRGRGYASACVAGLSQHALDHGAMACMLYTDLANPTSNKIYQAIGYRPVMDTREWRFN